MPENGTQGRTLHCCQAANSSELGCSSGRQPLSRLLTLFIPSRLCLAPPSVCPCGRLAAQLRPHSACRWPRRRAVADMPLRWLPARPVSRVVCLPSYGVASCHRRSHLPVRTKQGLASRHCSLVFTQLWSLSRRSFCLLASDQLCLRALQGASPLAGLLPAPLDDPLKGAGSGG